MLSADKRIRHISHRNDDGKHQQDGHKQYHHGKRHQLLADFSVNDIPVRGEYDFPAKMFYSGFPDDQVIS